jgi:AcrR family transcriptional regulator
MGRPRQHGEQTREALLAAAGRLLAEEGPGALSMRRLAEAVGTSTRAVYSVFGGKEGLLGAMYWTMAESMAAAHARVPQADDPLAELQRLTAAYRRSALAHPDLYPLMFGGAVPGFTPEARAMAHARTAFARVHETIARGLDAGRFRGRTVSGMAHMLWALVHGLASLELAGALGTRAAASAMWRDAVSTLLRGFSAAPPASDASRRSVPRRAAGARLPARPRRAASARRR